MTFSKENIDGYFIHKLDLILTDRVNR